MATRTTVLWVLFAVQALCCTCFLIDISMDFITPGAEDATTGLAGVIDSDVIESVVTFALFFGLAFTASELRKLQRRHNQMDAQLQIASGAFSDLLETRFREWGLTDAERDIGVLAIKGYAIADMAALRQTKVGTVKAQCASLYRKAGVASRLELLSLFLDDLMADELIPKPYLGG